MRISRAVFFLAFVGLAACSGESRLRDLRSFTDGPDEFLILPGKQLEAPKDYSSLPTPTVGGTNRTDQNPRGDAVAALGGKPSQLTPSGVPSSESGLVTYASRNGITPAIREELAEEDADFRKSQARFTKIRIVRVDRYNQAYRKQALDPYQELDRWRAAGVATPTAPHND